MVSRGFGDTEGESAPIKNQKDTNSMVFSGETSRQLWDEINNLDALSTGDDIRDVIYHLCCMLQSLEDKVMLK